MQERVHFTAKTRRIHVEPGLITVAFELPTDLPIPHDAIYHTNLVELDTGRIGRTARPRGWRCVTNVFMLPFIANEGNHLSGDWKRND